MAEKPPRRRLLLLTHRFPYPPDRGDRIRSFNLLRELSRHYVVSLACPSEIEIPAQHRQRVNDLCEQTHIGSQHRTGKWLHGIRSGLQRRSLTEGLFWSASIQNEIIRWQKSQAFDFVVVFCSSMFQYIEHPLFSDTPTVVDLVDIDSLKWQQMSRENSVPKRWIYQYEADRVGKLESRIADNSASVVLVSDAEAELFKTGQIEKSEALKGALDIRGISNGVDSDYFHPGETASQSQERSKPLRLVFTGVMDYPPNCEGMLWFCREVIPKIELANDLELTIVGRHPTASIRQLDQMKNVTVTGEVPDVRPYLQRADIAVSPLHLARGIQNKVLEAMAMGLPVIGTPQAIQGIEGTDGRQWIVADSMQQWVDQIKCLAADELKRHQIGVAARELVVNRYSWAARMSSFSKLLDGLVVAS